MGRNVGQLFSELVLRYRAATHASIDRVNRQRVNLALIAG